MRRRDRRRDNRMRRNAARGQALHRFVEAIFWNAPMPEAIPQLPRKTRRALEPILRAVNRKRLSDMADLRREHAEYREMLLPVISRIGTLSPGMVNRVPVMKGEPSYRRVEHDRIDIPTMETRTVDGRPMYAVTYLLAPEMLAFAVGDVTKHTCDVLAEIAHMLGRVIEIEAIRNIVYGLPLAQQGEPIGREFPRTADEVIAEHPEDAYSYVLDTTRRATAAGDWRVAHRFADIGRELLRRGYRDRERKPA